MGDMSYLIELGGRTVEVGLEILDGSLFARVGGKRFPVAVHRRPGGHQLSRDIDGQRSMLLLAGDAGTFRALWEGRSIEVLVEPLPIRQLRRHLKASDSGKADEKIVRSHMPGLIVKIVVEPGQAVRKGDGLVVLEAMKMENEIRAPRDGVIERIAVQQGQEVKGGQPLCVLKLRQEE